MLAPTGQPTKWWRLQLHPSGFYVYHLFGLFAVLALGTGFALLPYFLIKASENNRIQADFAAEVVAFVYGFTLVSRDSTAEVLFLQTLTGVSPVNISAFRDAADALQIYLEYIHRDFTFSQLSGISYAVRVSDNERQSIAEEGFYITEFLPNGTLVLASDRPEYFPILYIQFFDQEAIESPEILVGLDIASEPDLRVGMEQAAASGGISFVSTSDLFPSIEQAIVLIGATYSTLIPPPGYVERLEAVTGFVVGVLNLGSIVDNALVNQSQLRGIEIFVFDISGDSDNLLYPPNYPPLSVSDIQPYAGIKVEIPIETLNWTIVFVPTSEYIDRYNTAFPWVVLAAVLLATAFIIFYMIDQIRKRGAIRKLYEEKKSLLNTILPEEITKRLVEGQEVIADNRENACVLFMDISGFTDFSSREPANAVVRMLDALFTAIDKVATLYGVEKIKTIGDCYMAANGIFSGPQDLSQNVCKMLDFSMEVLRIAQNTFAASESTRHLCVRIGIHAGPVMAGVISVACKPHFDIWGDAVNVASRMESTGVPNFIQVSESVYRAGNTQFNFTARPEAVMVKGKGMMNTWFLVGRQQLVPPIGVIPPGVTGTPVL